MGCTVKQVAFEVPACHEGTLASGRCLNGIRCLRDVLRTVDSFHLIYICSTGTAVVVDEIVGGQLSGDGVPVVGAFLRTNHHVGLHIFLRTGRPREPHGSRHCLGSKVGRLGRCYGFVVHIDGHEAEELQVSLRLVVQGSLNQLGRCRRSGRSEVERTLAIANEIVAVARILQIPLLVAGGQFLRPGNDVGLRLGVVAHVHAYLRIVDRFYIIEAQVTPRPVGSGLHRPLLLCRRLVFLLNDIAAAAVVGHNIARCTRHLVQDFISTVDDRRRNILAPSDVDDAFGIGLSHLIARAARHFGHELMHRAVAVVVDITLS